MLVPMQCVEAGASRDEGDALQEGPTSKQLPKPLEPITAICSIPSKEGYINSTVSLAT